MTLRIIIRTVDAIDNVHIGAPIITTYKTFDIDALEIEQFLHSSGYNEGGSFLSRTIVGIEEL